MKNRNLALRTPSSFSYEMLLKDDQSIEHVKVTRGNQVLSLHKKQAYRYFYVFGEQSIRELDGVRKARLRLVSRRRISLGCNLDAATRLSIVAAIEPDLLLGRFAKNLGGTPLAPSATYNLDVLGIM